MRRIHLPVLVAAACVAVSAGVPAGSDGATSRSLQDQIDQTQADIDAKRRAEGTLSTQISGFTARINRLESRITVLRRQEAGVQADLDRATSRLDAIRTELRRQRARLVRLRVRLAEVRRVLAERMVARYQADDPDLLSVVLNAHGFAELLERGEFLRRIGRQDNRIIQSVRAAREDAERTAARLAVLEPRAERLADHIRRQRDRVAAVRQDLVDTQDGWAGARAGKARALAGVRSDRHQLEGNLSDLKAEQARITGTLRAGQGALPAGPVRRGSGSLVWPLNGPITSPFCERRAWEACHPGIDIGVPSGTPIRAAAAGTVALAGPTQGYGNYTCVQHPGVMSTCYAHQSSIGVSVGQRVRQGQVIGISGCTGLCFGPHLHFEVRLNGVVTNPLDYL